MKYIKKFETGEWSRNIDWEYVKENPDDDSDEYYITYGRAIRRHN